MKLWMFESGQFDGSILAHLLGRMSGVSPFYCFSEEETFSNIKHIHYDVHSLYHNATKYSLRFIYQTLRRNPRLVENI